MEQFVASNTLDNTCILKFFDLTISESKNNFLKYVWQIKIDAQHDLFLEHFPERPILPGAIVVATILNLMSKTIFKLNNCLYCCRRMEKVTFLNAITPRLSNLKLDCKFIFNNDVIIVQSVITDNSSSYFRGSFIFGKES